MKKQFSVKQIVLMLKQAELGLPVADLIRQVGISKQTYYRWKKQYAGFESDQVRELKQVVEENAQLVSPGVGSKLRVSGAALNQH